MFRKFSSVHALVPWSFRRGTRGRHLLFSLFSPDSGWRRALLLLVAAALGVLLSELAIATILQGAPKAISTRKAMSWVLNTGVVYSLILLLYSVTNRLRFALMFTSALLLVVVGSHINKMRILNRALMPWDLANWREIVALFPTMVTNWRMVLVLLVLATLVAWSIRYLLARPRFPMRWWVRPLVFALAISLPMPLLYHRDWNMGPYLSRMRIVNHVWDHSLNVHRNGLLLTLVLNSRSLLMSAPEGYSEETVIQALGVAGRKEGDRGEGDAEVATAVDQPVDVIVYMAESFWDPTLLGVPLSRDPMPFVRNLMKERTSGELLVPVFGGGTANTEFELLTGIPVAFLPTGSVPYQHYVQRPLPSLVTAFKDRGYRTAALHPFHRWFWSRETVYPFIGFDSSRFLDGFENARLDGPYVSDEVLVDSILEELDASSTPSFVFAITMSTHGPFDYVPESEPLVAVEGGLSESSTRILSNFASAIARADAAFERLTIELRKRDRPALVVFFGDHLPPLQGVYDEAGFTRNLAELGLSYAERMNSVPVVFWSTWEEKEREEFRISTNFLGPRVLEAAGMPLSPYFRFLRELSRDLPMLSNMQIKGADGTVYSLDDLRRDEGAIGAGVRSYELLGWDRLLGSGFSVLSPRMHAAIDNDSSDEVAAVELAH